MSVPEQWSAVPSPSGDGDERARRQSPARVASATSTDGLEARPASATTADGRVHGRPAPQYGEYAPEGWVNPVLVEQERQEREEAARARRLEAAQAAASTNRAPRGPQRLSATGTEPPGRAHGSPGTGAGGDAAVRPTRLGASAGDLLLTVVLIAFGLVSVLQSLSVGQVASTVARTLEERYTALADPQSLIPAALVSAIGGIVVFVLVVWWSVVRLRRGKRTFWVPLLGGVTASLLSTICFTVVVMQDGQFVSWVMQHGAG